MDRRSFFTKWFQAGSRPAPHSAQTGFDWNGMPKLPWKLPELPHAGKVAQRAGVPVYWTQTYWLDLTAEQRGAAYDLGFSPGAWDAGFTPHSFEQRWSELADAKRAAAETLGYDEQFWDVRVRTREYLVKLKRETDAGAPLGLDEEITTLIAMSIGSSPRSLQSIEMFGKLMAMKREPPVAVMLAVYSVGRLREPLTNQTRAEFNAAVTKLEMDVPAKLLNRLPANATEGAPFYRAPVTWISGFVWRQEWLGSARDGMLVRQLTLWADYESFRVGSGAFTEARAPWLLEQSRGHERSEVGWYVSVADTEEWFETEVLVKESISLRESGEYTPGMPSPGAPREAARRLRYLSEHGNSPAAFDPALTRQYPPLRVSLNQSVGYMPQVEPQVDCSQRSPPPPFLDGMDELGKTWWHRSRRQLADPETDGNTQNGANVGEASDRGEADAQTQAERWHADWYTRLRCWWASTPYRDGLLACMSSLGAVLASRLEAALRLDQRVSAPRAVAGGVDAQLHPAACDWVPALGDALDLPDFPTLPTRADSALLEFGREGLNLPPVLPLPRLLPSWAQLQSALPLDLQREDWQRWQLAANTNWRAPSASEGATRAVALMGTGGGILTVGIVALIWLRGRARYSAK